MQKYYFFYPLPVILLGVFLEYSGLDFILERPFYDASLNLWPYKSHWLASGILHTGGKFFVMAIALIIFTVFVLSFFVGRLKPYQKGAAYLLIAGLAGPALVSICKHMTHIYPPWDLKIFGGNEPYIRIFDLVPKGAKVGHAFPAGHSSGGFAFFSAYFLALEYRPSIKYYWLWLALLIGFIFGIAQQVRGAHFLSHNFFSLIVCWYSALIAHSFFFKIYPVLNNMLVYGKQTGATLDV